MAAGMCADRPRLSAPVGKLSCWIRQDETRDPNTLTDVNLPNDLFAHTRLFSGEPQCLFITSLLPTFFFRTHPKHIISSMDNKKHSEYNHHISVACSDISLWNLTCQPFGVWTTLFA